MHYTIYTDGGYSMRHNEGASAYVILDDDKNIIERNAFKIVKETSQRAELKAIIAAVMKIPAGSKADIFTDSEYSINILSGKWQPSKNIDLIDKYRQHSESKDITFNWVKGHSGDLFNEMCDDLCNRCVGYDLNEEFSHHKKEDRKVPTIKGDSIFTSIYKGNAEGLTKEDIKRRLIEMRDKLNEMIDAL